MIAALTRDRVIGLHGKIPWHYPGDLKRFKEVTLGSTVIMGRHTWESIGSRPLSRRRNLVVTRVRLPDVEHFETIEAALSACEGPVWFIGGARIYAEAMAHSRLIDLTYVPDVIVHPDAVRFPAIPQGWVRGEETPHEYDDRLVRVRYVR
jgi:dihydrofolate reductase